MENSLAVPQRVTHRVPYDPAISVLGIHPREMKTYVHTNTSTEMFTAALSEIAENWKQSKCPSIDEWIDT